MCFPMFAAQLPDPTDIGGPDIGLPTVRFPFRSREVKVGMAYELKETGVEGVNISSSLVKVRDNWRTIKQNIGETLGRKTRILVSDLRLQGIGKGILEGNGGQVQIWRPFRGCVNNGREPDGLESSEVGAGSS
jgi:hypothetical protein